MKFFIDTANTNEIAKAAELGMVDGVTTNPSLIAKENCGFEERIREICSMVSGPVSAEIISTQAEEMIEEAKDLAALASNIVVKVPMTTEGLRATKRLAGMGIKTNLTLIFSPLQALLAAKAGATYVSPFVGRLDDISHNGMELVAEILEIFDNYAFDTQIIVASIRHPLHVLEAARMGADIATIPYKVISQLAHHPLTDTGLAQFLADWEKVPKR